MSGRHRDRTDGRGLASFLERTRSSRPWKERQRAQDIAFACTDGIVRVQLDLGLPAVIEVGGTVSRIDSIGHARKFAVRRMVGLQLEEFERDS